MQNGPLDNWGQSSPAPKGHQAAMQLLRQVLPAKQFLGQLRCSQILDCIFVHGKTGDICLKFVGCIVRLSRSSKCHAGESSSK